MISSTIYLEKPIIDSQTFQKRDPCAVMGPYVIHEVVFSSTEPSFSSSRTTDVTCVAADTDAFHPRQWGLPPAEPRRHGRRTHEANPLDLLLGQPITVDRSIDSRTSQMRARPRSIAFLAALGSSQYPHPRFRAQSYLSDKLLLGPGVSTFLPP